SCPFPGRSKAARTLWYRAVNKGGNYSAPGPWLITGKTKSRCEHFPVRSGASSMTRMLFVSLPLIYLLLWLRTV
ncbi:hypothetical protein Q4R45_20370, partial [Morganella morganii subsp. sibonii]